MHAKYQKKYNSLQADLLALYDELKPHDEVVLNKKQDENTWSVLQTAHHLILAEQTSIRYIKKKMSFNPEFKNAGIGTSFRSAGLRMYLASPFKAKAPDFIGDASLPEKSSFWEVVKLWNATRDELKELLETMPDDLLKKEVYKHAFGGKLTILQMLDFFDSHFKRHRKQMRRTIKNYHFVV